MQLQHLRRSLKLSNVGTNYVVQQAFDIWPVSEETEVYDMQIALIWLVDVLFRLGVMEPMTGAQLARQLWMTIPSGADLRNPAHHEKLSVKIADRRYLAVPDGFYDLHTGATVTEPARFVEKSIYDLGALFLAKSAEE